MEFSALLRSGGPVSPAEFASMIGGYFRSLFVVATTLNLQLFANIWQPKESVSVQAFAAQLDVERLDDGVVFGHTR
jgi:hypothetical protein